jgi:hypothetical protein
VPSTPQHPAVSQFANGRFGVRGELLVNGGTGSIAGSSGIPLFKPALPGKLLACRLYCANASEALPASSSAVKILMCLFTIFLLERK